MTETRTTDASANETCSACGRAFQCGAKSGSCWCAGIQLTEEMLADLACRYSRCLCPECLSTAARRDSKSEVGRPIER